MTIGSVDLITITCKNDIEKLNKPNIPTIFKKYIYDYFSEMLLRFDCENLSSFGSIFLIESESELDIYSPTNASQFLNVGLITPNNEILNVTQLFFFEEAYTKIVFANSTLIEKYIKNLKRSDV